MIFPSTPVLIRGPFLGLVWEDDHLMYLRMVEEEEEVQILLPSGLDLAQIQQLQPWDWLQVVGERILETRQSHPLLKAYSITLLHKNRIFTYSR